MRDLADVDVHLITDFETAANMARWLSVQPRVAIDTETTGLSPERDDVRVISFSDLDTAYVVPLEGVTYERVPRLPQATGWGGFAVDMLARMSRDPDGPQIDMHNATYDVSMIRHTLGIDLPRYRIDDTRLMAHVADSRNPLGLKPLSKRLVDPRADLGQEILHDALGVKTGWGWDSIPIGFKPYWFYAGLDTILTRRVSEILLPKVNIDAPKSYELELAVSWPCEDMERKGVQIDRPYVTKFLHEMTDYIALCETWTMEHYGIPAGSDSKIIDRLLNEGVNLTKRTPSGAKYSLDKEVLSQLSHPLAVTVLGRRQAMKLAGYLRSYLSLAGDDDIIHPDINTVGGIASSPYESGGSGSGVRTGRMSMSNPNLQNVPSHTKEGARIRRCFVPREGNVWVSIDADQIESRILAHVTQDHGLIQAFIDASETGSDFFVNVAKQLFNDPDFQKSDPRRQLTKNASYAKVYGAGISKFAQTAGVDHATAQSFMSAYDTMFPGVQGFMRNLDSLGRQRLQAEGEAYVRSPLTNRKLRADSRKIYALMNYLIQGMAGEILKTKIVEAANAGLDEYMMFPVHDEIDLDVPMDVLPDVLAKLNDVMNDNETLSVPITWSSGYGPDWGSAK